MLAFLSQSPVILDGADRPFYRRFMKGLGRTQLFLERKFGSGLAGEAAAACRDRARRIRPLRGRHEPSDP